MQTETDCEQFITPHINKQDTSIQTLDQTYSTQEHSAQTDCTFESASPNTSSGQKQCGMSAALPSFLPYNSYYQGTSNTLVEQDTRSRGSNTSLYACQTIDSAMQTMHTSNTGSYHGNGEYTPSISGETRIADIGNTEASATSSSHPTTLLPPIIGTPRSTEPDMASSSHSQISSNPVDIDESMVNISSLVCGSDVGGVHSSSLPSISTGDGGVVLPSIQDTPPCTISTETDMLCDVFSRDYSAPIYSSSFSQTPDLRYVLAHQYNQYTGGEDQEHLFNPSTLMDLATQTEDAAAVASGDLPSIDLAIQTNPFHCASSDFGFATFELGVQTNITAGIPFDTLDLGVQTDHHVMHGYDTLDLGIQTDSEFTDAVQSFDLGIQTDFPLVGDVASGSSFDQPTRSIPDTMDLAIQTRDPFAPLTCKPSQVDSSVTSSTLPVQMQTLDVAIGTDEPFDF